MWARAWRCRPAPRPSMETSVASASCATSPTVVIPRPRSLSAVTGPTPQSRSTGSAWRKTSSRSGGTTSRPSGLATPLATLARNFVLATPTVMGRPTRSEDLAPQPHGDLGRRAREPSHAAHVEERLVDRHPFHQRAWCPRTRGTRPCSPRSRPTCGARPRPPPGTGGGPGLRSSRCGCRVPWPRSSPPARPRRRRSPAARAGEDRRAVRPTRRTRRGRRGGWSPLPPRTYVRIFLGLRRL